MRDGGDPGCDTDGTAADAAGAGRLRPVRPPRTLVLQLPPSGEIARAIVVVLALVALAVVLWKLASVVLLAFSAVLVAVGLRALGTVVRRLTGLGMTSSVAIGVVVVALAIGGFAYFLGGELVDQARAVFADLPSVFESLGRQLGIANLADAAMAQIDAWFARGGMVENVLGLSADVVAGVGNLIVVLTVGIYFAFQPAGYQDGLLRLLPLGHRAAVRAALAAVGERLKRWLRGQLFSMATVAVLTSIALLILGIPSWLALGVLAGALEFIPYAGPFIAAAPAVLTALGDGGSLVFAVIAAYFLVQQVEGNLITPLIQQRVADLPPVLAILALTAMGLIFGPIGVLLAIPAAIVGSTLVTHLYVRGVLHDPEG